MLNLSNIDLKKTQFYKDVFTEGKDEGIDEGKIEGKKEGRKEGLAKSLISLLEIRFSPLSTMQKKKVNTLNETQLLARIKYIFQAQSIQDIL